MTPHSFTLTIQGADILSDKPQNDLFEAVAGRD